MLDGNSGKPITQFAVRAREFPWTAGQPSVPLGKGQWTQVSNPDGSFELVLNEPGSYQAEVSAENYHTTPGDKVQVGPGAMSATTVIKLPPQK